MVVLGSWLVTSTCQYRQFKSRFLEEHGWINILWALCHFLLYTFTLPLLFRWYWCGALPNPGDTILFNSSTAFGTFDLSFPRHFPLGFFDTVTSGFLPGSLAFTLSLISNLYFKHCSPGTWSRDTFHLFATYLSSDLIPHPWCRLFLHTTMTPIFRENLNVSSEILAQICNWLLRYLTECNWMSQRSSRGYTSKYFSNPPFLLILTDIMSMNYHFLSGFPAAISLPPTLCFANFTAAWSSWNESWSPYSSALKVHIASPQPSYPNICRVWLDVEM